MTIRNLDGLFKPESIVVIGASRKDRSVGRVLARNLFNSGFQGPIMPMHPRHRSIEGVLAYQTVADLPIVPDLAVIATPPDTVAQLVADVGARGAKAAIVITAGFGEGDGEGDTESGDRGGASRRQAVLDAAQPHCLRVVGPNCLGVMMPEAGVNASFSHITPEVGDLAFVTQSGAMVTAMLDWAAPRGIGFSHVVSLGDMADVDFGDMLDYLALDPATRAILLYVEAITDARKFMSAARAASRVKPVIAIKAGRFAEGAKAAASHTGALAGADAVYDAAFGRAGMLRVTTLAELFAAAETLSNGTAVSGDRVAILTNGGGLGVLATDALIERGGRLAALSEDTMAALDEVLPPTWSHGNPVDIIGDATGERYAAALEPLMTDRNVDAVLALNCPTAVADSTEAAEALVGTLEHRRKPVFAAWLGDWTAGPARKLLAAHRVASYETPEEAIAAYMHLVTHRRHQQMLLETPSSVPDEFERDADAARPVIAEALDDGREWLTEPEAKRLLAAYNIPVVETRVAETPDAAAAAAAEIGFPVALKVLSPDITHKSDVGGVLLELGNADVVRAAAEGMLARIERLLPQARLTGFTVQAMVDRRDAHELILGIDTDRQFGPIILFGEGGTAVEVVKDRAIALPPLNLGLARKLMSATRVFRLLEGYRDRPAAAIDRVALALVKLSQIASDLAHVVELDINPLITDADGIMALDARVRIARADGKAAARLAIQPYPKDLEETVRLPDGDEVLLRPIRPEDEPALREGFRKLTPDDVRMRFFAPMKELDHGLAARLSQIDYTREMAFVAVDPDSAGDDIWGAARVNADPDKLGAEFAVTVRSDHKRRGLGHALMTKLIAYSAAQEIGELWGLVLADNKAMLGLAEDLGFAVAAAGQGPGVVRVSKQLAERRAA